MTNAQRRRAAKNKALAIRRLEKMLAQFDAQPAPAAQAKLSAVTAGVRRAMRA